MPLHPRNPITRSDESLSSSTDQPDSTSPPSPPASPPPTHIPEISPTYTPIPQDGESTVDVAHDIALIPHHVAHYAPLYPGDRVQTAQEAAIGEELRKSHYKTIMTYVEAITSLVSEVDKLKMERNALREGSGVEGLEREVGELVREVRVKKGQIEELKKKEERERMLEGELEKAREKEKGLMELLMMC